MLVTNQGMLIRMRVKEVSVIGRNTQGVRLISLESGQEKVTGVSKLPEDQNGEEEGGSSERPEPEASESMPPATE